MEEKILLTKQTMVDIAEVIREKLNTESKYKPSEMPDAIKSMSGTGGGTVGSITRLQMAIVTGLTSEVTVEPVTE